MQITQRFNRLFLVNNNWVYDEVKVAAVNLRAGETACWFYVAIFKKFCCDLIKFWKRK